MKKDFFMNYAEGQGAPTVKYEDETAATKEAERLAEKLGVEVTTLKAVAKTTPKDITKRVRNYADACKVLGLDPKQLPVVDLYLLLPEKDRKSIIAYYKLTVIIRALNEGWEPDWTNRNEYKYWPWFVYNQHSAGFGCATTNHTATRTTTTIGSRLCFKTRELAAYAGKTFEGLYNDFLLIK